MNYENIHLVMVVLKLMKIAFWYSYLCIFTIKLLEAEILANKITQQLPEVQGIKKVKFLDFDPYTAPKETSA